MTMQMMDWGRKRVKARLVLIGKDGEQATPVIPKPRKFIEINWDVLVDRLILLGAVLLILVCGFLAGAVWMSGG